MSFSKRSKEGDGLPQWKHKQWDLHEPNLNLGNESYSCRLWRGEKKKILHNCLLFLILLEIIVRAWDEYELRDMVSSFWVSFHEMTVAQTKPGHPTNKPWILHFVFSQIQNMVMEQPSVSAARNGQTLQYLALEVSWVTQLMANRF